MHTLLLSHSLTLRTTCKSSEMVKSPELEGDGDEEWVHSYDHLVGAGQLCTDPTSPIIFVRD